MNDQELVTKMKEYVADIRHEVQRISEERSLTEAEHKVVLKGLDEQLAAVRAKCPHIETSYFPDASGNNDSYYQCKWCGAEV